MSRIAERINQQPKASGWKGAWNLSRMTLTIIVLVHAGLGLDGWVSWAAWGLAAWITLVLLMAVGGLLALAVETVNREKSSHPVGHGAHR